MNDTEQITAGWQRGAAKLFGAPLNEAVMAAAGTPIISAIHGTADGKAAVLLVTDERLYFAVKRGMTARSVEVEVILRSQVGSVVSGAKRLTGMSLSISSSSTRIKLDKVPEDLGRPLVDLLRTA